LIFSFVEVHAASAMPSEFPYNSSNVFGMTIGGTVGVGEGVGVGVGVTVGVGVGVTVGEGVGVGVGMGVGEGVGVGVGVGEGVGVGLTTATPLFHTSFLPLLIHVYFLPAYVEVIPAFLHVAPALTAATAFRGIANRAIARSAPTNFFMP
jgi:hypothetical protein